MGLLCPEGRGPCAPRVPAHPSSAHPSILELLQLPADVVLLFASVVQAAQGLSQLTHCPVPLPPQVVTERPDRGGKGQGHCEEQGAEDSRPAVKLAAHAPEHPGCLMRERSA